MLNHSLFATTMASLIDSNDMMVAKVVYDLIPDPCVEAGCVEEQQAGLVVTESDTSFVIGEFDAVYDGTFFHAFRRDGLLWHNELSRIVGDFFNGLL